MEIWKYDIPVEDMFMLDLPENAKILTVQTQHLKPVLWCLVDPKKQMKTRCFRLAGTGHLITQEEGDLKYIGTFQIRDGALIFHLFEIVNTHEHNT